VRHGIPCPCRRLVAATAVCIALLAGAPAGVPAGELAVESDFPGGSVHVDAIDQKARALRVQPADHPGKGWRCWWFFKVTGIEPGETLTLTVKGGGFALPHQAAWSLDGQSWRQTARGKRSKNTVTYTQAVPASEAYFAWGPPFLPRHADALLAHADAQCDAAERFVLCRTREDRPTPALRIEPEAGGASGGKPVLLWVQARQHAWESGASWVADGFTRWLCSADARARALRRQCRTVIVPIMDVDNVVRGAGGKNQHPQDHNRDWSDEPHWHAVAAAQRMLRDLSPEARLTVFIDLHNPGPGKRDQEVFFYICPRDQLSPRRRDLLDALVAAAEAEMTAPLGFRGQTRESGAGYDKNWKRISKNWVADRLDGPLVAVTIETGWQTPHSTREGYVTVGRQMGLALERFLGKVGQ
jgi:hypothetical protein